MEKNLNLLEEAVLANDESAIIRHIVRGLRVTHLEVLGNLDNILNKNALYLLVKYGIDAPAEQIDKVLQEVAGVSNDSEALIIFRSKAFEESPTMPRLKNSIASGKIYEIQNFSNNPWYITDIDTITFSMGMAGYSDEEVYCIFKETLTRKSSCYFLMQLVELAKNLNACQMKDNVIRYISILEKILSEFSSEKLEQAILDWKSKEIIIRICDGAMLSTPDAFMTDKQVSFQAIMFLIEMGMSRGLKEQAIRLMQERKKTEKANWLVMETMFLQESLLPFPREVSEKEQMLETAIKNSDNQKVLQLVEEEVKLTRPDAVVDLDFTKLSVQSMIAVATRGLEYRVIPHIYKRLSCMLAYDECSSDEYQARLVVANLMLQVSLWQITWDDNKDDTWLYHMDRTFDFNESPDGGKNSDELEKYSVKFNEVIAYWYSNGEIEFLVDNHMMRLYKKMSCQEMECFLSNYDAELNMIKTEEELKVFLKKCKLAFKKLF